jgi:hypothetical protein
MITAHDRKHHLFDPSGRWLDADPIRQAVKKAAPPIGTETFFTAREH